ncbi:MAG: hypothetical protein U0264_02920 [Candidatus Kapaibacterium sp.]
MKINRDDLILFTEIEIAILCNALKNDPDERENYEFVYQTGIRRCGDYFDELLDEYSD